MELFAIPAICTASAFVENSAVRQYRDVDPCGRLAPRGSSHRLMTLQPAATRSA